MSIPINVGSARDAEVYAKVAKMPLKGVFCILCGLELEYPGTASGYCEKCEESLDQDDRQDDWDIPKLSFDYEQRRDYEAENRHWGDLW